MNHISDANGRALGKGEGNLYKRQNEVLIKVTASDTGGAYEVVEENCGPGFQSRRHIHTRNYETFYVMDGSAEFTVGGDVFLATKGACVHIPPNVPHQVYSKDGVSMLMVYSPGETEALFADMHALSDDEISNPALTKAIAAKHNTVMIEDESRRPARKTVLG